MLNQDPVTLYSPDGRRQKRIAAIDAPGWIAAGWSVEPVDTPYPETTAPTVTNPELDSSTVTIPPIEPVNTQTQNRKSK